MSTTQTARATTRLFDRYKQRLTARFTVDESMWRSGLTHDISPRGLRLACHSPPAPGTSLRIEVRVPVVGEVSVRGHVVWARNLPGRLVGAEQGGFAVEIDDAPEAWFSLCARLDTR